MLAILRFTIRDVLWLTVVVALLSLWAVERQYVHNDWEQIHYNEGRLHQRIEQQRGTLEKMSKQLKDERTLRLEIEGQLAEAERRATLTATGP